MYIPDKINKRNKHNYFDIIIFCEEISNNSYELEDLYMQPESLHSNLDET